MLTVLAPAKLNLTLEVLGKRPDGFHEIRSVIQAVDLCDRLTFKNGKGVTIKCDLPGWSAESSLVGRAVALMQEAAGASLGVSLEMKKHIPLLSGLGGDSSGAAAVLRGLNDLWGLNLSQEILLDMAAQLGSDVSFFIWRGTALAEGRGEKVTPLPPLAETWFVLVVPDVPRALGKTAGMYAALSPAHFTDGHITRRLAEVIMARKKLKSSMLFNTFENIAFADFTMRQVYVEHLVKLGAPRVHLAGSGPALFAMFNNKAEADDLLTRCKDQGMDARLVSTALP
jgi:4-diphosphocytidyl-2-C-methyl-D-erythritol kinase